jgi:hypothetical protein
LDWGTSTQLAVFFARDIALAVVQPDVAAEMAFELSSIELLGDYLSDLI